MTGAYPIRVISEDEFPGYYAVGEHAFNTTRPAAESMRHELITFEADRSLAAFDGAGIVGTTAGYSFTLTVPGAPVPAAGVTGVSVLPSHRRRGILSSLMRRQLDDLHERGEAVAVLYASEAGIYRRFGYGPASQSASFTIRRGEGVFVPDAPADPRLRLRITEPAAAREALAAVYATLLPARPGLFARDRRWWDSVLDDPEYARHGATALRCLLAEDDTGPRGYALYRTTMAWDGDGLPDGTIAVEELVATGPPATAALWADLLTRDLTTSLVARLQPADDPLPHLLADPRRARAQVSDALWVRLTDVGRALSQRRYAAPADVVIEVTDEFCPWNTGRWLLATGPADGASADGVPAASAPAGSAPATGLAASCERTSAPAGLAMPAYALGAAYLGGTRLGPLAAAGLITELRPGALAALSAAMSWEPGPWCPVIF